MPPNKSKYNTFAFNGLDVSQVRNLVLLSLVLNACINKELTLSLKANITNPDVIKAATILIITFPPTYSSVLFS